MWINKRPFLSPMMHNSLLSFAEFKADMHNIYNRVRRDLAQQWTKLLLKMQQDVEA